MVVSNGAGKSGSPWLDGSGAVVNTGMPLALSQAQPGPEDPGEQDNHVVPVEAVTLMRKK